VKLTGIGAALLSFWYSILDFEKLLDRKTGIP
jgi:hypothetical protein